ncbi:MAG: radical SAM family heme chaperone HemW [Anaerolineae bacterium]|nr:radical SAM family heme chaperone HemW [Anaerolineae bacterium]MDW8298995.1 radical SAM family heme chaperone HemW [Anaerolineae bacterium]
MLLLYKRLNPRAIRQKRMLDNSHAQLLSLYLHIPFCKTRCTYCAFNTYTNAEVYLPAYVAALRNELRWLGAVTQQPVHTIFFGGGTPSLLSPSQIADILHTCRTAFQIVPELEITLEVNPFSVTGDYFERVRAAGVNRLSIGMQSVHRSELRLMARDHDAEAVPRTVRVARAAGFENINLDLIFALPYQTLGMWQESLRAALDLQPQHLSLYALELESGTAMTRDVERGRLPLPDEELAAQMYEVADAVLAQHGFEQYEISNWARPGWECRHNLQYWRNLPYLGVGAGAHGYANGIRYAVVRAIPRYIALANAQSAPLPFPFTASVEWHEVIDTQTAMLEHLLTGLRLVRDGVRESEFEARFGVSLLDIFGKPFERLRAQGLLQREGETWRLTSSARLISNRVFTALL